MAEDTTGMATQDGASTPDSTFGNDAGGEPTGPTDNHIDGDGTDDGDESIAGTDPLDATSAFLVTPSRAANGDLVLTWPSKEGNTYAIRKATAPDGPWNTIRSNLSATPSSPSTSETISIDGNETAAFYIAVIE